MNSSPPRFGTSVHILASHETGTVLCVQTWRGGGVSHLLRPRIHRCQVQIDGTGENRWLDWPQELERFHE